ncbi:conjugal transfer protein TraD [Bradyrhizobium sp. SZCCHNR1004]|nr:conjugal transfer protein TraD [Bradyrhizobium sp. SZCCHNR1004]
MRRWQVERRKRTRRLIELGGLVVKAGVVDLTGDDRATILGALLWISDTLRGDRSERGCSGPRRETAVKVNNPIEVLRKIRSQVHCLDLRRENVFRHGIRTPFSG